jgi:hypothetical protein
MLARIHINKHIVAANNKHGHDDPAITVKTYKSNTRARAVQINGPCRLTGTQDGKRQLPCGANIWIEADTEDLEIIE